MTKFHIAVKLNDEVGTDGLPLRFVAAAMLMAVIVALSATAVADFLKDTRVQRFSGDLAALEARAAAIYQHGGARDISNPNDSTGTRETFSFTVPAGIKVVVLGAMPPLDGKLPSTNSESNIIYYTTYQGVTRTFSSSARYGGGPGLDRPIILTPGRYELTCELVKNQGGTYISLH